MVFSAVLHYALFLTVQLRLLGSSQRKRRILHKYLDQSHTCHHLAL